MKSTLMVSQGASGIGSGRSLPIGLCLWTLVRMHKSQVVAILVLAKYECRLESSLWVNVGVTA
jgi:hypothetical protein